MQCCVANIFVYYLALFIGTYTIPVLPMSVQNSYFCCLLFLRLFVKKEHSRLTLLWHGNINRWFSRVPPISRHDEQILVSAWTVDFIAAVQFVILHKFGNSSTSGSWLFFGVVALFVESNNTFLQIARECFKMWCHYWSKRLLTGM